LGEERKSRRTFLGTAIGTIVGAIVTGAGVWALTPKGEVVEVPKEVIKEITKTATVTEAAATATVTKTATVTEAAGTITKEVPPSGYVKLEELAVTGATPDERAVNGAKAYMIENNIDPSTVALNMIVPSGTDAQTLLGAERWTNETGIKVTVNAAMWTEVIEKIMSESVTKKGTMDLFATVLDFLGTFVEIGVADERFDAWVKKYDPEYDPEKWSQCPVPMSMAYGQRIGGKYYGFNWGADSLIMQYRNDILQDPETKKKFNSEYPGKYTEETVDSIFSGGPVTWDQFEDLVRAVDTPEVRGAFLFRDKDDVYREWLLRYWQVGGILFDDDMNPKANTPEGVKVSEDMHRLDPYMDSSVFISPGWPQAYAEWVEGKSFCLYFWPQEQYLHGDFLPVVRAYLMPGYYVNGKLNNNAVVGGTYGCFNNRYSKQPELAYLLNQYLESPLISRYMMTNASGAWKPFRVCQFNDPELTPRYPPGVHDVWLEQTKTAVPVLPFRAMADIYEALGTNLNNYFAEVATLSEALKTADEKLREAVETRGKEASLEEWKALRAQFPQNIKEMHGW